jgi:DNA-binding GntR family transcriptional regulator
MIAKDVAKAGKQWHAAKARERDAAAKLYAAIVQAVEDGMTEVQAAELAGVNRMTVRRALGKL